MKKLKNTKPLQKAAIAILLMAMLATTAFGDDLIFELKQVFYPIYTNGSEVPQGDLPVLNYNGSTYVPLRKLSEAADVIVEWDDATQSVNIDNDYKYVAYFQKLIIAEEEAGFLYENIVNDINYIWHNFTQYAGGNSAKQEALDSILSYYKNISTQNSIVQHEFNNLFFPNGLDTTYEYENTLSSYINNVNSAFLHFEQLYNYAKGYIEGIYTFDYASDQLLNLQKQIYDCTPSPYTQKYSIIKMISDAGY